MIVTMKKVSVVTLQTFQEQTLSALREVGVLHIFTDRADTARGERLREEWASIERALATIPVAEDVSGNDGAEATHGGAAVDHALRIAEDSQTLSEEAAQIDDALDRVNRELERLAPWGEVDVHRLEQLHDAGVDVALYERVPERAEQLVQQLPHAVELQRTKTVVRVVGIAAPGESLPTDQEPLALPESSVQELQEQREQLVARRGEIDHALSAFSPQRPVLQAALEELEADFEYVRVQSRMDSQKELSWVTGFLPYDRVDDVKAAAEEHGWGIVVRDPDPDEHVPTQVRNPKPVGIIKPVFDLLGTVPGYREMDISFFFLLFFVVFFAMIIGDGGYGAILLAGTLVTAARGARRGKPPGPGTALMVVLSTATVVWGAITGNWFGYAPFAELPVLRNLVIPSISAENEASTQTIQYMTFVIGTIHLSIAHVWNFIRGLRVKPRIAALEQLGWLSMVLGLYYLVLELVLGTVAVSIVPRPDWWMSMIVGGLIAVMAFGRQESGQNFFIGVAKGVANIITTALDGISAFSDIISYIRLFAVGLASLAIAEAFNSMAGGIAESMGGAGGAIVAALILFLGHSLNLAMGALSVIVHGVRLNMLEFSGHLGMEWTGVEYSPFRARKNA
ncbi:MAG: V-type ATP synthase subunit I [Alkalispirochaeta sp.]